MAHSLILHNILFAKTADKANQIALDAIHGAFEAINSGCDPVQCLKSVAQYTFAAKTRSEADIITIVVE